MTGSAFTEPPQGGSLEESWRHLAQLVYAANGSTSWQRLWNLTGVTDNSNAILTVKNQGSGGHINVPGVIGIGSTGLTTPLPITSTVTTGTAPFVVASTTKVANFNADLLDDLTAGNASGNIPINNGTLNTNLNADLLDGNHASAFLTQALADLRYLQLTGGTISGGLIVQGPTALGDANTDAFTVVGLTTYRNAAATAVQMYVDAGNNRVLVGTTTALTTAADDKFSVVGGSAYVAANSAETALGLRYAPAATGSFFVGASNSNTPDGIFKNSAGTQVARAFNGGGFLVGTATSLTGSEKLEVSTGGLRVQAGGIVLAGSGNIDGNSGTAGQIRIGAVIVNAANLDGSEEVLVNGQSRLKGDVTITTGTFRHESSGNARIEANSTGVGFFGATPIARPNVVGVRTGTLGQLQTVVANLLTALGGGQLGLITDSTT